VKVGNYTGGHNIFIDDAGFLYVARPGLRIYDLKPNPLSPALVWERTTPDSHDMCVIADVLYDFDAEAGTRLYDVTNPKAPILRGTITDPNMVYHHNGWPTRDHGYLFITDEFSVHPQADVTVWDIHNLAAPFKVASIADATATVHNCYVVGNLLVMSYYTAGFKVFDVSDPVHPAPVYSYDTSSYTGEGNFDGAWGCYAYAPGNRVYITDRPNGLFIFELTGATPVRGTTPPALSISAWPNPTAGLTHVTYTLARGADVTAAVYDVRGTLVKTLDSGWHDTGARELTWDGTNHDGVAVSSGAYYLRVRTAAGTEARKITLVR
jgi:hypothetical protein